MIAIRRVAPSKPTAIEPIAIAAGPAINLKTIPNTVSPGPQAMNFS